MSDTDWTRIFREIYEEGLKHYAAGRRGAPEIFRGEQVRFLESIGCSAQELYDFVEDAVKYHEPDFATCLLITAVRRDYFLQELKGRQTGGMVRMEELPAKTDAVEGIEWLPRLMAKARAKLRGEMNPDLMYGCGGDRAFARQHGIHLADFLRLAWSAGDNDRVLIDFVKSKQG
ncbi:MAG: hypothetical protein SFU85_13655 [Candidatus Methylacidiphilales bacterium]|nr:hypothetical protein [Candidatus Methylacidiphilales bacterium]